MGTQTSITFDTSFFKQESDVDDYVKEVLQSLGLKKRKDFNEKSAMSDYMKESLKGASKTKEKSNFGIPDFSIEIYQVPIIIENKLGNKWHEARNKSGLKMDDNSVRKYAVNGAIYYAKKMIASKKYDEVIAIGISAESKTDVKISIFYVFSALLEPKKIESYTILDFVQSKDSFAEFYKAATVTEEEKHRIIIRTRDEILRHAKKINVLMNDFNVGVDQRVVYVSGMLLSMQDIFDDQGDVVDEGLTPDKLTGIQTKQNRDGVVIVRHLDEYLQQKSQIPDDKRDIMMDNFKMVISGDADRDKLNKIHKNVAKLCKTESSITKQIFVYLYEYIFKSINLSNGVLDLMAEMYSTFLKYALSDGAQLGKVLTPPYITNLMAHILDINKDSRVIDLATGSAAFLVAAMDLMVSDANTTYGKGTEKARNHIKRIKEEQLLGVEIDAKMYTLAATNMILRGDGSTHIMKADTFKLDEKLLNDFAADRFLLNPPFSAEYNGLLFFEHGLDHMEKGGKAAVIIQDSVGAGKAIEPFKRILSKHKMLASIKMPADLFVPNAIVQTSIYVFEAKTKHNYDLDVVKFIDFSNDGYKRTERVIKEVDSPEKRYVDIYLIYKLGWNALNHPLFNKDLWDMESCYCEDTLSGEGNDLNFEHHGTSKQTLDHKHLLSNIAKHLVWDMGNINHLFNLEPINQSNIMKFSVRDVFTIDKVRSYDKGDLQPINNNETSYDYITRTTENRGICEQTCYLGEDGLCERGTFSLGLMSKVFFYREKPWYAGQFIRIVRCKYAIDDYVGIYLENELNTLSVALNSKLVRDVDETFYDFEIDLPADNEGNIDFVAISKFVKDARKTIFDNIQNEFYKKDNIRHRVFL